MERLAAYRGVPASVGLVLADSLGGWHDPEKVNIYFQAYQLNVNFFSNDDIAELRVLWQMRHSIVHTGAWLTLPDAQKVEDLKGWAHKPLIFKYTFIQAVSRKLHALVEDAVHRLEAPCRARMKPGISAAEAQEIDKLFEVQSINQTWLNEV